MGVVVVPRKTCETPVLPFSPCHSFLCYRVIETLGIIVFRTLSLQCLTLVAIYLRVGLDESCGFLLTQNILQICEKVIHKKCSYRKRRMSINLQIKEILLKQKASLLEFEFF